MNWQSRSKILLGGDNLARLGCKNVLIVGLGGVGGYAFETVVRSGIGSITVVDGDVFDISNLNRQLLATTHNIGKYKAEEAALRALAINPEIKINAVSKRFNAQTAEVILCESYDYIIDCIDSVKDKVLLITEANKRKIRCISAMGAANRLDLDFVVTDIYKTSNDGLARAVRRQLRSAGVTSHKIVYSESLATVNASAELGSVVFPPAVCGIMLGREVVLDLIKE